eukprot:15268382-Ditylum_brightwellii.AAC.1
MIAENNTDMFVDDNALMHYGEEFDKKDTIITNTIQHDVEIWGRLLWVSGGLLEMLKITYCLVMRTFKEDRTPQIKVVGNIPENTVQLTYA